MGKINLGTSLKEQASHDNANLLPALWRSVSPSRNTL